MANHEWEVNYNDGKGWEPIDEYTMRRRLEDSYKNVGEVVQVMHDQPKMFHAHTGFSSYRLNPDFKVVAQ